MGKFTQGLNTAALRTGNTIATPFRRWGEIGNALANISRQWYSSSKNITEVTKQTRDALVDNFLNFSKIGGKWYQKMLKVPLNFVSAVTRRPFMISGAGIASQLNQWVRQPFKKLLYTPGKMFKGMRNATRIFSKKKGFDFQTYDTHETWKNTWVNMIKEGGIGFLGRKGWSSEKQADIEKPIEAKKTDAESKPIEVKKEEKPIEVKKPIEAKKPDAESKPIEVKKEEKPIEVKKSDAEPKLSKPASTPIDKPKSIADLKKNNTEETEQKEKKEKNENFPKRSSLDPTFKKKYKIDYTKKLKGNLTKEWIVARGKEAKLWTNAEEIVENFKKIDPTFAGYMEEEILKLAA